MIPPDLLTRPAPADPALRDALMALVSFGVRIAQAAAAVAEADSRIVAVVAAAVPGDMAGAQSMAEAQTAGQAVDAADHALAQASSRLAASGQTFDRVSRAVRRTAALVQRLDCGWPRRGGADDRRAMARRHVARSVGDRIARQADGEAAERLFDDLEDRLDTLELESRLDRPAEEIIAEICRDLGLAWAEPPIPHPSGASPAGTAPDG